MSIRDQFGKVFDRKLAEPAPQHLRDTEAVSMEAPVHGLRRLTDFIANGFDPNRHPNTQPNATENMPGDLLSFFNLRFDHGCPGIRSLELTLDNPEITDKNYTTSMAVIEGQDIVALCARQFSLLAMRNVMLHAGGQMNEAVSTKMTGMLEASARKLQEVQSAFIQMSRLVERDEPVYVDRIRAAYSGLDAETIMSLQKQLDVAKKENAVSQITVPLLSKLKPKEVTAAIVFIRECLQATKDTLNSASEAVKLTGSAQQIAMQKGQTFQLDSLIRNAEKQILVYDATGEVTDGLQAAYASLYKHHNSGTHAAMMLSIIMDNGIEAVKHSMEEKIRAETPALAINGQSFAEAVEEKARALLQMARDAGEKGIAELTVVVQKDQESTDDIMRRLEEVNAITPRGGFIQESSKKNALVTDNGDMRMLQVYVPSAEFLAETEEGEKMLSMLESLDAAPESLAQGMIVYSETLTMVEQAYSEGTMDHYQMIEKVLQDNQQITNSVNPETMADVAQLREKLAARDEQRQAKRAMMERMSTVFGIVENSSLNSKRKKGVPITATLEDLRETYGRFFLSDDGSRFDMLDVLHKTDAVKDGWLDANAVFCILDGGLPFGDKAKHESFEVLDHFMKVYAKSVEHGRLHEVTGGISEAQALWLDWFDYDSDQELSQDELQMASVLANFGRMLTMRLLQRGFGRDYFPLFTAPESPNDLTH